MRSLVRSLVVSLLLLGCGGSRGYSPAPGDDAEVLRLALAHMSADGDYDGWLLLDRTVLYYRPFLVDEGLSIDDLHASERDCIERSEAQPPLPDLGPPWAAERLLPAAEYDALHTSGVDTTFWESFHAAHAAGGLLMVSVPGYSPDGMEAVVYFVEGSGGLAGSGWLIALTRRPGGEWTVVGASMSWIA